MRIRKRPKVIKILIGRAFWEARLFLISWKFKLFNWPPGRKQAWQGCHSPFHPCSTPIHSQRRSRGSCDTSADRSRWKVLNMPEFLAPLGLQKNRLFFLWTVKGLMTRSMRLSRSLDNDIERLNRYVSLSRRNSLFFGSHKGAERGAMFYSLVCSCRLNGVNFFEYISDVINKAAALPPNTPLEKYRMLLPDKWKENR